MWRMGVPVATPVNASDFLTGLSALLTCRESYRSAFENDLRNLLGVPFVRGTNSGRAALFFTLQAMKKLSSRDEVIVPAFVCPSVGRAVVKAGLKPVLCDVTSSGSGLDAKSLERTLHQRTLAVVAAHLYGYPFDVTPILKLAHSEGAMVVEDGAQAFGAKLHDQYVGTRADAGVFSFGMSKVLWSINGGLITSSNPELIRHVDDALAPSPRLSWFREAAGLAKFGVLAILVRSHHLRPLSAVWSGAIRGRSDCEDFTTALYPQGNAAIGSALLPRLTEITRVRRRNASYFADRLSRLDGLILPNVTFESDPVYLRFPIVVKDTDVKQTLIAKLRGRGINVSEMYTRRSYEALRDLTGATSGHPHTEYLMERMLNLPTHQFMRECHLNATVDAFESVLGRRRASARVFCARHQTKANAN
jgi:dTDP-4-amino-4,6-dideoxygalactose transaminase